MFFWCGMIAELISCIFWVPVDILKERLQVQKLLGTYNYKNSIDAVRQIAKKEGFFALYRAYGATVLSFGPYTGISLGLYDKFKSKLQIKLKQHGRVSRTLRLEFLLKSQQIFFHFLANFSPNFT